MGNLVEMIGMPGISLEMVEIRGIRVRMWKIRAGMWGTGVGIRAIVVEMRETWGNNEGNHGVNLCIGVELMN